MGKRSSQRRHATVLDIMSDDDSSGSLSPQYRRIESRWPSMMKFRSRKIACSIKLLKLSTKRASIKKGSSKEISLASHAIGILALTVGCGNNAREILENCVPTLSLALKSGADSSKVSSILECLAIGRRNSKYCRIAQRC